MTNRIVHKEDKETMQSIMLMLVPIVKDNPLLIGEDFTILNTPKGYPISEVFAHKVMMSLLDAGYEVLANEVPGTGCHIPYQCEKEKFPYGINIARENNSYSLRFYDDRQPK